MPCVAVSRIINELSRCASEIYSTSVPPMVLNILLCFTNIGGLAHIPLFSPVWLGNQLWSYIFCFRIRWIIWNVKHENKWIGVRAKVVAWNISEPAVCLIHLVTKGEVNCFKIFLGGDSSKRVQYSEHKRALCFACCWEKRTTSWTS